jgi:hypothetical protein
MPRALYPTKARILRRRLRHRRSTVALVRAWKREFRGRRRTPEAVDVLIARLATHYARPVSVHWQEMGAIVGDAYSPHTRTMFLNASRVSIVTALHEFAHHLFGRSELTACRWSIWLFRRTFRRTYRRLGWRGHMLVRGSSSTVVN